MTEHEVRRGTTPDIQIHVDLDLTAADVVYLTFKQGGSLLLELGRDELEIREDTVSVRLRQEHTLTMRVSATHFVEMQLRARFPDGTAVASNIMQLTAAKILKEGEI